MQPHEVIDELNKAAEESGSLKIMDGPLARVFSLCQVQNPGYSFLRYEASKVCVALVNCTHSFGSLSSIFAPE